MVGCTKLVCKDGWLTGAKRAVKASGLHSKARGLLQLECPAPRLLELDGVGCIRTKVCWSTWRESDMASRQPPRRLQQGAFAR